MRAGQDSGVSAGLIVSTANVVATFICERPIGVDDGDAVVRAWRELEFPPLADFRREALLIARACKESMNDRFARDVRGEGWAGKSDASKSVSSVLRVSTGNGAGWSERLCLADKHAEEIDGRSRPVPALTDTPVDGDGDLTVPMQSSEQPVWLDSPTPGEWTFARDLLRKQFREDFESWFEPVKLGGVSGGLVVLECTKFAAKVLSGGEWLPAIEAALGANVAFRVVVWGSP